MLPRAEHRSVRAVRAVNAHAATAGDEPHDLVTGHRRAAAAQAYHDVVKTFDVHAGGWAPTRARSEPRAHRGGQLLLEVPTSQLACQALGDRAGREVAVTDGHVQRVDVRVLHLPRKLRQRVRSRKLLQWEAFTSKSLCELIAPGLDRVLAALATEPLSDLVPRPWRGDDQKPVS